MPRIRPNAISRNAPRSTNRTTWPRLAPSASRGQVVRFVLRGAFLLIAFGLILGIPLSLATSRVLSSQLYGLNQLDPVPIVLAVAVLGLFGLIATLVPARRATRVDPMAALRYE